jgi:xanthine dehydrogenase FAD-binding subunit
MFNFKSYTEQNPEAHLIAGGTDVLVKLHKGKGQFDHLVDIHDIAELNFIDRNDDGDLVIGPSTCFTHVAESALIRKHIPVLTEAILTIGGPQVRNMATQPLAAIFATACPVRTAPHRLWPSMQW